MQNNYDLKGWVEKSLGIVRTDPKNFLPLGYRETIKRAIGPYNEEGNKKRALLDVITAEKVMALWYESFEEDIPKQAIEIARNVLNEKEELDGAEKKADRLWVDLENSGIIEGAQDWKKTIDFYAGVAAVKALYSAILIKRQQIPEVFDFSQTDTDQDPYTINTEYCALVSSAGLPYRENFNPQKSLEFWTWWLEEAVSMASKFK